jgi:hypothetical protein
MATPLAADGGSKAARDLRPSRAANERATRVARNLLVHCVFTKVQVANFHAQTLPPRMRIHAEKRAAQRTSETIPREHKPKNFRHLDDEEVYSLMRRENHSDGRDS